MDNAAHRAIVKAIVCLNFREPEKALDILLGALSDLNFTSNFTSIKENTDGNRTAA